jgi:hypothetical protein
MPAFIPLLFLKSQSDPIDFEEPHDLSSGSGVFEESLTLVLMFDRSTDLNVLTTLVYVSIQSQAEKSKKDLLPNDCSREAPLNQLSRSPCGVGTFGMSGGICRNWT